MPGRLSFLGILVVVAGGWMAAQLLLNGPIVYGAVGTGDFIEYWAAYQLFVSGGNPYDPASLLEVERSLGFARDSALMMWNPPWLLVLLAPVLSLDFPAAARVWLLLSPIFLLASASLIIRVLARNRTVTRRTFYAVCGASLIFFPVLNSVFLGQMGLFLCFGTALFYWSVVGDRDLGVAMALLVLSIKPHLFLLLGVALLWWMVSSKRAWIAVYFGALLAALASAVALVNPAVLPAWLVAVSGSAASTDVVATGQWAGSTLVGAVKGLLAWFGRPDENWVMLFLPLVGAAALVTFLWGRRGASMRWESSFPWFLCLSVWVAPFGWLFDFSVLLVAQLIVVGAALQAGISRSAQIRIFALLAVTQLLIPLMIALGYGGYHHFWWFPAGMLAALWALRRSAAAQTEQVT